MTKDARVELPPANEPEPVKAETYCIRGETVAVGGALEWILGILAGRFARSLARMAGQKWDDLKKHIETQSLDSGLRKEIGAVGNYFAPRNLAAHAAMVIIGIGESTQIIRLFDHGQRPVEQVTLDELRAECATAREGYEAIQAIGRALDDGQPSVLAGMNQVPRAILLGRT